jgi:hypothetical protein
MFLTRKGSLCKKFSAELNGQYSAKLHPFVTSGNFKHIQQQNEIMSSGVCVPDATGHLDSRPYWKIDTVLDTASNSTGKFIFAQVPHRTGATLISICP